MNASALETGDSEDLEALFDSISHATTSRAVAANDAPPVPSADKSCGTDAVMLRVGQMTRKLHDTLRELGYDKMIEEAASAIPDARDRLAYVASMTEQAAQKVLAASEQASPLQEQIEQAATSLAARWDVVFANQLDAEQFKLLARDTRDYLNSTAVSARATKAHLMDIMMAQDFQDLTGQVIKRITELAQLIEKQLVELLWENTPEDKRPALKNPNASLLNGPAVTTAGATNVMTNQDQVDALLESLGF